MSIVGIGTDIVEIERLTQMPEKALHKLMLRVLTSEEQLRYQSLKFPIPYLAKRWAAKEAAAKALGTGIAKGVSFQDFQINNGSDGEPSLAVTGKAAEIAASKHAAQWHISLSDEKKYALAFVTLSSN